MRRKLDHWKKQQKGLNKHGIRILANYGIKNGAAHHKTTTSFISPAVKIVQDIRQNPLKLRVLPKNSSPKKAMGARSILNRIMAFFSKMQVRI